VATVFELLQEHQQRGEFFSRLCELPNLAEQVANAAEDVTRATGATTIPPITAPSGAKLGATKPAIKAKCPVHIALFFVPIAFRVIILRPGEVATPFGELVTPFGDLVMPVGDLVTPLGDLVLPPDILGEVPRMQALFDVCTALCDVFTAP
jgi:hypothetical protein